MSPSDPWVEIPVASVGRRSRKRVNPDGKFALFWFRDESGRPGLLIEISTRVSSTSLKDVKLNISDISVDVEDIAEEKLRTLVITLDDLQHQDVFLKLCQDLIEHVTDGEDNKNTFYTICGRLKKWQSLLSSSIGSLLSANEVRGLYAELYFMAELLAKNPYRENLLINGWKGPEKTQQDYILDDVAVEIKSVSGNQRGKVRISSEDQLDTHLDKLFLRVYFLAENSHDGNGESLNAIVKRIADHLTGRENKAMFELKLEMSGYIDISDYDAPLFRVKDCRTYLVSDNFPRITRRAIPDGIEAVSYDLVLAGIENFKTDIQNILGDQNDGSVSGRVSA